MDRSNVLYESSSGKTFDVTIAEGNFTDNFTTILICLIIIGAIKSTNKKANKSVMHSRNFEDDDVSTIHANILLILIL